MTFSDAHIGHINTHTHTHNIYFVRQRNLWC